MFFSKKRVADHRHYDKKCKVEGAEVKQILFCPAGLGGTVLSERYKACKRGYDSSRPAYVDSVKQCTVVFGEFRKKDRRRNVAYKLTGRDADEQCVFCQQCRNDMIHGFDT